MVDLSRGAGSYDDLSGPRVVIHMRGFRSWAGGLFAGT
jgi:hypothetical protein